MQHLNRRRAHRIDGCAATAATAAATASAKNGGSSTRGGRGGGRARKGGRVKGADGLEESGSKVEVFECLSGLFLQKVEGHGAMVLWKEGGRERGKE